ncbi:class I SAM-dependent methyltransferase [Paraferrimonas sedimenticola]|uniref:class I SAM-dependent methyltransferase n=1 Tax=Paraferrimonas sedimenticola TaxID=375674 RepID=UPI001B80C99B
MNLQLDSEQRNALTDEFALCHDSEAPYSLVYQDNCLGLIQRDFAKMKPVVVDFVGGAVGHRRKFGGGRGQAIAKAVGLKKGANPSVIDATAGLGRDAFVLASLGCKVTMVERHPVVAALLADGLKRAQSDADIGAWVSERMRLVHSQGPDYLVSGAQADVVYLDPMYPHREKSAQVKKEMAIFQGLVGADLDSDALLAAAKQAALKRVVVKRPDYASPMAEQAPDSQIETKKNRFDLYIIQKPIAGES